MSKNKAANIEIEESSGNVFADLGVPYPEEYLVKAELAIQINKLIKKRKLNQTDAAKLLGLDQPKISALNRGRLAGFSVERLFKLLAILDQDIEIVIKPHSGREEHSFPHVHVRYAAV
jgi:predicted XRE-type DNA-binding protein